ncbi:MAG: MBL fold metallo-hydrolase [Terrisporobacter sp.]|uniref:MBL fold metallo-hydrolase n=1 Tax=Terrisporobacter sp. TaxID=1965305 RepID=UPI002FC8F777
MYELIQVDEKTYYINCPAKIGIYKLNDSDVCLIDSGNDKDAGRKINKILNTNHWNLKIIINTHSNGDHIGGNNFLQKKTDCKIISTDIENTFTTYPILEPSFLYGGYPNKDLRNKFLMANPSTTTGSVQNDLPDGLEYIKLPGHFFDMIGIKTDTNVYFLADCLFGENIINKYHLSFVYDVKEYLNTLDMIQTLEGKLFIPAHSEPCEDIKYLAEANKEKVYEIINKILEICKYSLSFEDILQRIFTYYDLKMDFNQYVLIGSAVRSYLSYLYDEDKLQIEFNNNKLIWKTVTQ